MFWFKYKHFIYFYNIKGLKDIDVCFRLIIYYFTFLINFKNEVINILGKVVFYCYSDILNYIFRSYFLIEKINNCIIKDFYLN